MANPIGRRLQTLPKRRRSAIISTKDNLGVLKTRKCGG
jgi:hypothetical protein